MLLGLGLSFGAQAQHHEEMRKGAEYSPEEHAKRELIRMRDHLNLNEDQIKEISPLLIAHHKEMAAQKEAMRLRRLELKTKMQDLLTDDQEEKLKELHQERRKMRKERRKMRQEEKED